MPTFKNPDMPRVYSASLETLKRNARNLVIRLTQYPLYAENMRPIGHVVFTLIQQDRALQKEQTYDENYLQVVAHEGDLLVVTVFDITNSIRSRKGVACYEVSLKDDGQLIPLSSVGGIQFALYYSPYPWRTQELQETLLRDPLCRSFMDEFLARDNPEEALWKYVQSDNMPSSFYTAIGIPSDDARLKTSLDYEEITINWEVEKARYFTTHLG